METVGIIGAGQMGSGIAQVVAQHGMDVLLADIDIAVAQTARDRIATTLDRLVAKDKTTRADADALLARIAPVGDYARMADAGLIIEAATERERSNAGSSNRWARCWRRARSWPATPVRSRSPAWPPPRPIRRASSGCISSTRCR